MENEEKQEKSEKIIASLIYASSNVLVIVQVAWKGSHNYCKKCEASSPIGIPNSVNAVQTVQAAQAV